MDVEMRLAGVPRVAHLAEERIGSHRAAHANPYAALLQVAQQHRHRATCEEDVIPAMCARSVTGTGWSGSTSAMATTRPAHGANTASPKIR
jgi:hypothetical protein